MVCNQEWYCTSRSPDLLILEDGLEPRMLMYLKVTRSSNPWRWSVIKNGNVPQGHWSSPRPWRWSGTIPWWPLVQNVSSSLGNPQDFQPTQYTCSNLKLQKRESSWPKNYDWSTLCKSLTSPFLFIKYGYLYHQRGFSNLEKTPEYVIRGQCFPSSRVWQPSADSYGRMAPFLFEFKFTG